LRKTINELYQPKSNRKSLSLSTEEGPEPNLDKFEFSIFQFSNFPENIKKQVSQQLHFGERMKNQKTDDLLKIKKTRSFFYSFSQQK